MIGSTLRQPRGPARLAATIVLSLGALTAACTGAAPSASSTTARSVPSPTTLSSASPSPGPSATESSVPEPSIVSNPIPFPEARKEQMLAYAREHYGLETFRLVHPQVIVEHFTASSTFEPVYNTFAANTPHLGELPGTCAHFVVDTDGTIYQLVSLDLMCRHTVGLNYTAIGIEMVGQSDADILGNASEREAALRLTLWLMQRFHIALRNVIGHNESLTSPWRLELVPSLRCQTHQDWNHADMEVFRQELAGLAERFQVPLGPPAKPMDSGC
jgi:N-acetylmuramoyl-L-alanine amidase